MSHFGFVKVAAGVPLVKVADTAFNAAQLEHLISQAAQQGVRVVAFPELCLTGYTCGDLFLKPLLAQAAERVLGGSFAPHGRAGYYFYSGASGPGGQCLIKCVGGLLPRRNFGSSAENLFAQL